MNTLSFPQITVSYKDADASKRIKIHSSKESYDILKTFYEDCMQHHEECWAMYLNRAGKLLGVSCISRSGIDCTVVDIRIVLQTALVSHASGIILSHNHPSGSTVASTPGQQPDQPVEERLRGNRHTAFGPHHTDRGHLPQLHGRGDALSVPFFARYPFCTSFLS